MRQPTAALAAAVICVSIVGCASTIGSAESPTTTRSRIPGCGRALAHRNNIIIDVNTCSADPADSAVKIAQQPAANVTARW